MVDPASVAAAVKAALDCAQDRLAAIAFLDSIKSGDVRVLGGTAFALSSQNQPLEVRHYGLKLLQHLVRIRWDELNHEEKGKMTGMVLDMVKEFATPHEAWSMKSQTAALVAEVTRREEPDVWKGMLKSLLPISDMSPVHAEMVAMVMRWLPEDVIVHNEDLETTRRRQLLSELTESLPQLFPFFYKLLEKHFGAGMEAMHLQQMELAKQHAAVVTAALQAVLVYAEWSPVTNFSSYGLVEACGFLINSPEFRLAACEILKQLLSRRKPYDEDVELFNSVLARVYEILSSVCDAYFVHYDGGGSAPLEFAECLCEALVALGSQNLQVISSNNQKLATYYRQMLKFLQHSEFPLHVQALPLWLGLLRDSLSVERNKVIIARPTVVVPIETASVLLDVAFQKLLKDGQEEEFTSAVDYSQYRGRLIELIRLVAHHHHDLGITKVVQRLDVFLTKEKISSQEYFILESTHTMLDAVVTGCFARGGTSELLDGLLQRLLTVHWSEPELVEIHAKCFDALVPYIKNVPTAVPTVIQKLFQLLVTVPVVSKEASSTNSKARFQVCTSFLRIAKLAGPALFPHMQIVAETMTRLQQERHLLRGEYILLGESLLVAGSTAGQEQQNQVLEWLLGPFRDYWCHSDWQQKYLCDPAGFVRLLGTTTTENLSGDEGMWYIFHSIHFFEKALRRCAAGVEGNPSSHPMAVHMSWILPPLIQLLRCLHSLWIPSILSTLPPPVRQAIHLSASEQASILGESKTVDHKEDELRNWLKSVRDSGYNVLRYASSRLGNQFFVNMSGLSGPLATGLMESLSSMEFRHLRSLVHSVIQSFVRFCPQSLREVWLGQLLPPLLVHCHATLPLAWENLVREGAVKTGTLFAVDGSSGINTELVEERMLRELTREVCTLLAIMASSELNPEQQPGMLCYVIQHSAAAFATVHLGIQSLQWPDSDAVHRGAVFCGAVIDVAGPLNDTNLREIVGKDMFTAIIQSLTLESNSAAHAELLGLLREILVKLSPHTSTPK
ncbi:protein HASTY 1, partial [Selaginella moellendorffii]|uniref:protein HASTY 1 n=1 Tax=Selaginella moellendorffii TaxID=88036 RepID=UPI000D1CA583